MTTGRDFEVVFDTLIVVSQKVSSEDYKANTEVNHQGAFVLPFTD
jgi:hypothetical protein